MNFDPFIEVLHLAAANETSVRFDTNVPFIGPSRADIYFLQNKSPKFVINGVGQQAQRGRAWSAKKKKRHAVHHLRVEWYAAKKKFEKCFKEKKKNEIQSKTGRLRPLTGSLTPFLCKAML